MAKRAVGQSVRRWNWAKYSSIDAIQTSAISLLFIPMTFQSEPSRLYIPCRAGVTDAGMGCLLKLTAIQSSQPSLFEKPYSPLVNSRQSILTSHPLLYNTVEPLSKDTPGMKDTSPFSPPINSCCMQFNLDTSLIRTLSSIPLVSR